MLWPTLPSPVGSVPPVSMWMIALGWLLLSCENERTTASLLACLASSGKVPPSVRPGIAVFTSPVTRAIRRGGVEVRIERLDVARAAAEKQQHDRAIADVVLARRFAPLLWPPEAAAATSPPSPSTPARTKSRRDRPLQSRVLPVWSVSMARLIPENQGDTPWIVSERVDGSMFFARQSARERK